MTTYERGTGMYALRSSRERERGQVLVIVAGGAMALILLMGLVIDVGVATFNRRDGQNMSDLMSMAGAKYVADVYQGKPQNDPAVVDTYSAIEKTSVANGCQATDPTPCTWEAWYVGRGPVDLAQITPGSSFPTDCPTPPAIGSCTIGVRVAVNRQPGTFIVGSIGMPNWNVDTQAIAIATKLTTAPAGNLLPIAFNGDPDEAYQPGQVYDLTDGKDLPGGFGWLSWDGSNSAGALATSLCVPNNPEFYLPRVFPADPGKTNSSDVRACLDGWIASKKTVLIPMYDIATGTGNNATYRIIGVAAFVLTARDQPAVDNIRGFFVEIYANTDPVPGGAGALPPGPDDTMFNVGLIK